jgi:hypothetical protein
MEIKNYVSTIPLILRSIHGEEPFDGPEWRHTPVQPWPGSDHSIWRAEVPMGGVRVLHTAQRVSNSYLFPGLYALAPETEPRPCLVVVWRTSWKDVNTVAAVYHPHGVIEGERVWQREFHGGDLQHQWCGGFQSWVTNEMEEAFSCREKEAPGEPVVLNTTDVYRVAGSALECRWTGRNDYLKWPIMHFDGGAEDCISPKSLRPAK